MPNRPIIVGGFYRSGTTLVRRLLDSHSRIHCGPEVKFFKDMFDGYQDDPLVHARFFSTARSYGLPEPKLLQIFGRAFLDFHEAAAAAAGKARWADKNPENVFYLGQWQALLPEGFLFVHVVRNPLDALASLVEIGFKKTVPLEFAGKVQLYRRFRDCGAAYCRANPATSIEIRYEDLVTRGEVVVSRLMRFIGEEFERPMLTRLNAASRGTGIEDPKAARHSLIHADSVGRGQRDLRQHEIQMALDGLAEYL